MTISIFSHGYERARQDYTCWCCGEVILNGASYFTTGGTVEGRFFKVKHCRSKCECTSEMLDQNPYLHLAVFSPTLPIWVEQQPDEWKERNERGRK